MNEMVKSFVEKNKEEMFLIIEELCKIPAPSNFEHKRAEYCKKKLEEIGAKGVYIDEALNVVFPLNCENSNEIAVFTGHTDTVFPDLEPMPYIDDGEKIHSPGVADDTCSVAVVILMAKFFIENNIVPEKGIMFVCNSCEEGLGNLKGVRQIFKDFEGRITSFIAFDGNLEDVVDVCVGSHRYEVEVLTEGGHSWTAFGNNNAIAKLSEMINEIYKIEVPEKEGSRTTYNVGIISGGTSVNTIAQNAKMLCEYRSNDKDCLEIMQKKFEQIFEGARSEKVKVNVVKVGDRPCGNTEIEKVDALKQKTVPIIEAVLNKKIPYRSGSTDCNIPMSLGVPALCMGVCRNFKTHTREEYLEKATLIPGLEIAIKIALAFK
ncbi:MAG: M20/M25/M40 family metallo-hydrolase [Clostridia bacterium]|nr:M20/M25/M40 family metallo-hydrolase [Clostridia bacterium]